jgi:uncharacterized membrane protein
MSREAQAPGKVLAVERILAKVLRLGSMVAGVLLAAGIGAMPFTGAPLPRRLVTAGLVTLLFTPVLRVLVAGVVFCKERDWLFALFCLVVLCSLAVGMTLGLVG